MRPRRKAPIADDFGIGLRLQTMRGLSSDIRYALRALRRGGISTVVAMLSLAVGVMEFLKSEKYTPFLRALKRRTTACSSKDGGFSLPVAARMSLSFQNQLIVQMFGLISRVVMNS